MSSTERPSSRRRWLRAQGRFGFGALAMLAGYGGVLGGARAQQAAAAPPLTRALRSGGEALPLVGLGTWITFNVGNDARVRDACAEVVRAFFAHGGRMIDSSPMYGSSQPTIGHALAKLGRPVGPTGPTRPAGSDGPAAPSPLFSAEKVWIGDGPRGAAQIEASRAFWGVPRFDLLQVHNLLAWQEHLPRLLAMKAEGKVRYVGITTSEGRRHGEIERIMKSHPIDFVQVTYNLLDREVEQRILPLAAERGIAVIANRPFREGALLRDLQRHRLPGWAAEIGCDGWAQAALKFIVSHPAVTCAIPATSQVAHVVQNMGAARGPMPDATLRARMAAEAAALV